MEHVRFQTAVVQAINTEQLYAKMITQAQQYMTTIVLLLNLQHKQHAVFNVIIVGFKFW